MLERLEAKAASILRARRLDRMTRRYGGIQKCTWCRQCAQDEDGWNFAPYQENVGYDVLTCGVCGGTSLWLWGMGMHFIRPLDPPKPAFQASEVTPPPQSNVGLPAGNIAAASGVTVEVVGKIHFEHLVGDGDNSGNGCGEADGGDVIALVVADFDGSKTQLLPGRYVFCNDLPDSLMGLIPSCIEIYEIGTFEIPDKIIPLSQVKEVFRHQRPSVSTLAEPSVAAEGSCAEAHTPQSNLEGTDNA
tara:strand:+ start:42092 stop:42829 length:738 start_codon:yes stop_codon:yes gene_type:complete